MADEPLNPPPPEPLGEHGKALWDSIAEHFILRPDEHRTLANACKLADQVAKMERVLDDAGNDLMIPGSRPGTYVAHPILAELRMSRQVMSQLLARLDIPDSEKATTRHRSPRPQAARKAARARWDRRRSG